MQLGKISRSSLHFLCPFLTIEAFICHSGAASEGAPTDVEDQLRVQLANAKVYFQNAKNELVKIGKQIGLDLKKAPRRPRDTAEELDNMIDRLEFSRSTSSLSLNEVRNQSSVEFWPASNLFLLMFYVSSA